MIAVQLGVGLLVGVVLGLLGAGGSLLTVPALVLLLGLSTPEATGTSLVAVAFMAASGVVVHRRAGRCSCREGLLFGAAAAVTAVGAGLLASAVPEVVLTIAFVALLLGAAAWLAAREDRADATDDEDRREAAGSRAWLAGGGVGVLTGLLGVGGGFLVVPALVATRRMPMPLAVGTSQLVVLVSALAGLVGRLPGGTVQWDVGVVFGIGGLVGAALGSRLANRIPAAGLRRGFAVVAVGVAGFLVRDLVVA